MMKNDQHNQYPVRTTTACSGFTLIELLISLAILAIGILGIASLQIKSINSNALAARVTTNVNIAADRLENAMAIDYSDLISTSPLQTADGIDNNGNGIIDESDESGAVEVEWTVIEDFPIKNTKVVKMTITRNGSGGKREVELMHVKPKLN